MLSGPSGSWTTPKIKMSQDLVLRDIGLVILLVVFRILTVLVLNLSLKFIEPLLLWNLKSAGESTSLLIVEFGYFLGCLVFNLKLHLRSHFWNLTFWVNWTHTKPS
jgi:hypothetical protein